MKKIQQAITAVILVLLIASFTLLGYLIFQRASGNNMPMVFNWASGIAVTGSMEPAIPVGSWLLIHPEEEYVPGDIVAYPGKDDTVVIHRLISVDDGMATIKGDANNENDPLIPEDQIIGKVHHIIPKFGAVYLFLKQPPIFITILVLILIAGIAPIPGWKKKKGVAESQSMESEHEAAAAADVK